MINMQIANTSTDGEKLEVLVHPEAGGTDRVVLEANTAYVISDMDQTTHFEVQPHVPGVESNIVSIEPAALVGDPEDPEDFNPEDSKSEDPDPSPVDVEPGF